MKRNCKKLLYECLKLFPCVAIVGVRQSGKTTLLSQLPKSWQIFDLEKESDFQVVSKDIGLFFELNNSKTAIDESQLLPELFSELRVAIDADRSKTGRFIISGSSSPKLLKSISESLAGRVAIIELSPFSLSEAYSVSSNFYKLISENADINTLKNKIKIHSEAKKIHKYWLNGGYPEPWIKNNKRFLTLWRQNYTKTYLNRDILKLFPNLNSQKFRLFLQMLANLSGSIINYSNIARAIGVSQPTIRDYFAIADGTFIWRTIPPYEKNATKRIVKHPKGYLRDSGLLHHFLHLDDLNMLLAHPIAGFSWEAMVIENIIREFNFIGEDILPFYFRTNNGAEVDLIIEGNFGLLPIEIKYSQNVTGNQLKSISNFVKDYKCKYGIIISNISKPVLYDKNLIGIPFGAM